MDQQTNKDIPSIARRTVELCLRYYDGLPEEAIRSTETARLLLETVKAAGFETVRIDVGNLYEIGSENSNNYHINKHCRFMAIDSDEEHGPDLHVQRGCNTMFATMWLDSIFRIVYENANQEIDALAETIETEIRRAHPLEPIRITAKGDSICENRPVMKLGGLPGIFDHTKDSDPLPETGSAIGNHKTRLRRDLGYLV